MSYPPNYNACKESVWGRVSFFESSFPFSDPPQPGYPPQYPQQGYPQQGYPPQGYPPQGYPPQPCKFSFSLFFRFFLVSFLFWLPTRGALPLCCLLTRTDGAPYGAPGVVVAGNSQAALQADMADGRLDGRAFGAPVVNAGGPPHGYGAPMYAPGQVYINRKGKSKTYKLSKQQKKSMKHGYPPGGY